MYLRCHQPRTDRLRVAGRGLLVVQPCDVHNLQLAPPRYAQRDRLEDTQSLGILDLQLPGLLRLLRIQLLAALRAAEVAVHVHHLALELLGVCRGTTERQDGTQRKLSMLGSRKVGIPAKSLCLLLGSWSAPGSAAAAALIRASAAGGGAEPPASSASWASTAGSLAGAKLAPATAALAASGAACSDY